MRLIAVGECMVELSAAGTQGLWHSGFAGDTLNTAWYARAALPKSWQVEYLTAVGIDPLSDRMLAFLKDAGIGTTFVQRHPSRVPGLYMIELNEGERTFTYWRDTSAARTLADDPAALRAAFAGADVIYVSGITVGILGQQARADLFAALGAARAAGARVVFDPNLRPRIWPSVSEMCAATTEAARHADIVLPSHDDEAAFFGDANPRATAERYIALGAAEVLVKNGGAEMVLAVDGQIQQLDAMERVKPVDTTGAGDSFNGGYLAARLTGASAQDAVAKGHALAMRVVQHRGALIPQDAI